MLVAVSRALLVTLALSATMLSAAVANAVVTDVDDATLPASPDGFNLTQDSVTGLEWLDLTVTAGRTWDDIVGNDGTDELGTGGDFEGFRYATYTEVTGWSAGPQVDSLFSNFGFNSTFSSIGTYPLVRDFMSHLSCFTNCGTYGFTQGIFEDDIDPLVLWYAHVEAFPSSGFDWGSLIVATTGPFASRPVNGSLSTTGHFLVRPLPEPGGSPALAAGLVMLACLTRRRDRE
jgi:hypothetical protein